MSIILLPIVIIVWIVAFKKSLKKEKGTSGRHADLDRPGRGWGFGGTETFSSSYAAKHLCEENSQNSFLDERGYAQDDHVDVTDTINSYSMTQLGLRRGRVRYLTREELANKEEELKSLLDAGILTREEYHMMLEEYRMYTA